MTTNIVIIGAYGSARSAVADELAEAPGIRLTLVDDGELGGGLCILRETKNEHTSDFAAHRRAAVHRLAERENVEFIHGSARFVDDHVVRVDDRKVEADYVVMAIGPHGIGIGATIGIRLQSEPRVPPGDRVEITPR